MYKLQTKRECPIQIYAKITGFSTKRQGLFVNKDVKLTSCLLVVEMKGC